MASSSIFSQYLQPVRSVADYRADMDRAELAGLQVEGARRENAIKALLADQSVKKQNALQQIAAGWTPQTTMEDRITSLRGNPLTFGEADSLEKSMLDRKKTTADIAKTQGEADSKKLADAQKRLEVAGQAFGFVRDNPTIESAQAAILGLLQAGVYDENGAQAAWARVQSNPTPEGIRALATQAFQQALSAKEQLPQYFNQNRGGTYAVVGVNPVTGAATDAQSAPITQSADNAATNARIVAEGAANRAVTMRGQNMTDARAREATAATMTKPFEVTGPDGNNILVQQDKQGNIRPVEGYRPKGGEKPLNENQSKALLFGTRMQEAGKVLDALEQAGTTTSIPGARAGYGVGATLNFFSSAQQQQLNQAKRDFLNAVLRRESGAVIADSEFANGDQQYFPQQGDSKEVIAQKKRNRELATELILREVPADRRGHSGAPQGTSGASGSWPAPAAGSTLRFDAQGNPVQ